MQFLKASHEHLDDITKLLNELEKYNDSNVPYEDDEKSTEEELKDFVSKYFSEDSVVFLAVENNESIGYIRVYYCQPGRYCVIDELYTKEEHRGKRVGKQLLELAEEWAKTKSNQIKLEVFDWNKNAIEFYEKNKYEKDSVVYMKWLD